MTHLAGIPKWLQVSLFLALVLGSIFVGMSLGQRRDAVSWTAGELLVQSLGWEQHFRSARQIPREQVRSYLLEWRQGPWLRLRLQSGEKIIFGPGAIWSWREGDQPAFVAEALDWLETGPTSTRPEQEPTFWERPAATVFVMLMTVAMLGATGWGLVHGLGPGKSWWGVLLAYLPYLLVVLTWWRARRGKAAG